MPLSGYCTFQFNDTIFSNQIKKYFPNKSLRVDRCGSLRTRIHLLSTNAKNQETPHVARTTGLEGRDGSPLPNPKGESWVSERPYLKARRQEAAEEGSLNPPLGSRGHRCSHAYPHRIHTRTQNTSQLFACFLLLCFFFQKHLLVGYLRTVSDGNHKSRGEERKGRKGEGEGEMKRKIGRRKGKKRLMS